MPPAGAPNKDIPFRQESHNSNSRLKKLELEWEPAISERPEPQVPWEQAGFARRSGSSDKNAVFIWKWNKAESLGFLLGQRQLSSARPYCFRKKMRLCCAE
jgi:hypothetical protein